MPKEKKSLFRKRRLLKLEERRGNEGGGSEQRTTKNIASGYIGIIMRANIFNIYYTLSAPSTGLYYFLNTPYPGG